MSIAVIIVTYNSRSLIQRCLDSLRAQTRRPDRIVVIDNKSSDNTAELIEKNYPEVTLLRQETNTGFAKGNNIGIEFVDDCELVALINPDAFPHPQWLATIEQVAKAHTEYGSYASLVCIDGTKKIDGAGDVYHTSGIAWRRFYNFALDKVTLKQEEVLMPSGAAAVYRRDALLEAEGFDEDFFCYFEDIDLGLRLQLLGHRCLFVPEAVVDHVGSASTSVESDFALYHGYRNLDWTYLKCMPWPNVLLTFPSHGLMNLLVVLKYMKKGKPWTILKAKIHSFWGILRALKKRKRIQKTASEENKKRFLSLLDRGNYFDVMRGKNIPK